MPATILDLAIASNTVYNFYKGRGGDGAVVEKSKTLPLTPPGYHPLDVMEDSNTGFLAAVYKKLNSGETIVACRGTVVGETKIGRKVGTKNIVTDIGLYAIESLPSSMDIANEFVKRAEKKFGRNGLILCGHSLGGAIATILAFQQGFPCCTFNAPTVTKIIKGGVVHGPYVRVYDNKFTDIEKGIINFNLQWDPISKTSKAIGKVVNLPAIVKDGGHSQDKVVVNLKSSSYGSKYFADILKQNAFKQLS